MAHSNLDYSWKDFIPVYGIARRVALLDLQPKMQLKDYGFAIGLGLYHGAVSVPLLAGAAMGLEKLIK